jgi:hypothetical protein
MVVISLQGQGLGAKELDKLSTQTMLMLEVRVCSEFSPAGIRGNVFD